MPREHGSAVLPVRKSCDCPSDAFHCSFKAAHAVSSGRKWDAVQPASVSGGKKWKETSSHIFAQWVCALPALDSFSGSRQMVLFFGISLEKIIKFKAVMVAPKPGTANYKMYNIMCDFGFLKYFTHGLWYFIKSSFCYSMIALTKFCLFEYAFFKATDQKLKQ